MSEPVCAICGKPQAQAYRPFCSKRCADVDLQRWLVGAYAIPVDDGDEAGSDRLGESADDED
jgi:endogenous inhibitor of DNA gyrase (YacG/DUF329 family)